MGTIYREIRQTRPFARREEEALVALFRTTDLLRTAATAVLDRWGISPEQYNALRILRGSHPGGHPTLDVATRMVSRSPNITRLIDKLIVRGFVQRQRSRGDRRVVTLRITSEGLRATAEASTAMGRMILENLSCLNESRLASLIDALDAVRARITQSLHQRAAEAGGSKRSPTGPTPR